MNIDNLLPHIFSTLSLIECQADELQETIFTEKLLPAELIELRDLENGIKRLRQTANFIQLANAKNDILESHRLMQIFYGVLWIVRPSLQKMLDAKEAFTCGKFPVPSRLEHVLSEVYEKDNAH